MEKLRLVYIFYFHLTPSWKIMINNTELISLEQNKIGCMKKQWVSMQGLPSSWSDDNKEDGKQGRRNGSKSQWLSFSSRLWLTVTDSLYVKLSGLIRRWESFWSGWDQSQMSVSVQANGYIPHNAKQIKPSSLNSQKLLCGSLSCIIMLLSIEERQCSDWMCKCRP